MITESRAEGTARPVPSPRSPSTGGQTCFPPLFSSQVSLEKQQQRRWEASGKEAQLSFQACLWVSAPSLVQSPKKFLSLILSFLSFPFRAQVWLLSSGRVQKAVFWCILKATVDLSSVGGMVIRCSEQVWQRTGKIALSDFSCWLPVTVAITIHCS